MQDYFARQLEGVSVSPQGIAHLRSRYWEIEEMVEAGLARFETTEKQTFILDLYVGAVADAEMESC